MSVPSTRVGLSVVVPVYNSEELLPELVRRLSPVLQGLGEPFELLLVNDASRDGSWRVIQELTKERDWVRGICLTRNFGQHNALLCGIRATRLDKIVTMDDDLQNPPEAIPQLLKALSDGYDVVYGTPLAERHGIWRDLASRITKAALQGAMAPFVSIDVLLTWATTRFAAVAVQHEPRKAGASNYTFFMLLTHALNMMTGFTVAPLQVASWTGFAFAVFGSAVLAYVVGRYLLQGIIGEYLARMHFRTMEKPQYVVRELAG